MDIKETIQHQQKVADNLISKIRILDPTCIIAGGCCRDWFANKPAKDIDLFYYDGGYKPEDNVKRLEGVLGSPFHYKRLGKDYQGPSASNISSVIETFIEGVEINLIAWNRKTFNVTNTFPAYNSRMHYLPGYGNDKGKYLETIFSLSYLYCKEIYVCNSINKKYWDKLKSKFPDCKIIVVGRDSQKRKISLEGINDWGAPTQEELQMNEMLYPEMRLTKAWVEGGVDITNYPPSEIVSRETKIFSTEEELW